MIKRLCLQTARGQGRGVSLFLTKSLFTQGFFFFLNQGSVLSHYSPAEEIMTCRCSAVGRKLVFLFFFILLHSKAAVVRSHVLPPSPCPRSRLSHTASPQPCYITGNVCRFLSGTREHFSHLNFVPPHAVAVLEKRRHRNNIEGFLPC